MPGTIWRLGLWPQSLSTATDPSCLDMPIAVYEGNGNPLQYSCLENPMDRGAWQSTVYWVTKSRIWLSTWWSGLQSTADCNKQTSIGFVPPVGHFQDETSLDSPCWDSAPRERGGLSSKRSRSDSTHSGLVWSFLPPFLLLLFSSFCTSSLNIYVTHSYERQERDSLMGDTGSADRYFIKQGGEHTLEVYSGHAGTTTPSRAWCRQMRRVTESLPGSNEPYGNLLNCIHEISRYFPCKILGMQQWTRHCLVKLTC